MEVILKISTFIALLFQCLSGYFCQDRFENVAFNKTCNISSIWYAKYDNPQFAVNNNTDGFYGDPPTNCIQTGKNDLNPWWEVDLGRPYPVSNITVWARTAPTFNDGIGRMAGCVITVGSEECYEFSTPLTNSRIININCKSGIKVGSKVRVSKNSTTQVYINICEFQVWSCRDPYWGLQCENNCGHCADVCDKINGDCICSPGFKPLLCVDECDDGTYGQNCSSKCSENCDGVCDKKTGTCSCKPGSKTQSQFCDTAIGQMNVCHTEDTVVGLGVAVAVLTIVVIVLLIRDLRRPNDSRHHTMTSTEIEIRNSRPPSEQRTDNADGRENAYDRLDRQEIYDNAKERSFYMDLTSSQTHAVLKS